MSDSQNYSRDWAPLIAKIAFLALTVALVIAVIYLVRFVLHAIILGTLFAIILMPLHRRLTLQVTRYMVYRERRFKKTSKLTPQQKQSRSRLISSMLMVCLVFFVMVIPLCAFMTSVAKQGAEAIPKTIRWVKNDMGPSAERFYLKNRERLHLDALIRTFDGIINNYFNEDAIRELDAKGTDDSVESVAETTEGNSSACDEVNASDNAAESAQDATPKAVKAKPEATQDASHKTSISTANLSKFVGKIIVAGLDTLRKSIMSILKEAGIIIFNFF
ncbi:MAG: hypothetical protein IJS15_13145, partial [Victivallales bacterium]|nr:hypothetical protein [Victivallales bacterium]